MKQTIEITGVIDSVTDSALLKIMLTAAGMTDITVRSLPHYGEWLAGLPSASIVGLNEACREWIRHWGNGGGDSGSETCVSEALTESGSDVPAEIAESVYNSIAGYSKTEFDAAGLTMELVCGCMDELRESEAASDENI